MTGAKQSTVMIVKRPGMELLSFYMYDQESRYSMTMGEQRTVVPWPADFPTELVFDIFKYLSQAELAKACLVSKYCMFRFVDEANGRVYDCF